MQTKHTRNGVSAPIESDNTPTPGYIRGLQEGLELTQRHTVQVFLLGSISGAGLYHAILAAIALVGAA